MNNNYVFNLYIISLNQRQFIVTNFVIFEQNYWHPLLVIYLYGFTSYRLARNSEMSQCSQVSQ